MGDPWKVSRSRERQKNRSDDDEEEDSKTRPSFVEKAYDKTTAIVSQVKELFVNGFSKLKNLLTTERGRSKTSRS